MQNTKNYELYVSVCSKHKEHGTMKTLEDIEKYRRALKASGCYSKNPDRIRWMCFIADHMISVRHYILETDRHGKYQDAKFYLTLKENNIPTKPKTLRKLIGQIESGIAQNSKEKNWRNRKGEPISLKQAAAKMAQEEDTFDQTKLDEEMEKAFYGSLAAANQ